MVNISFRFFSQATKNNYTYVVRKDNIQKTTKIRELKATLSNAASGLQNSTN